MVNNLVNELGLNLKHKIKKEDANFDVGEKTIKSLVDNDKISSPQDFAGFSKKEYAKEFSNSLERGYKLFGRDAFFIEMYYKKDKLNPLGYMLVGKARKTPAFPLYGSDLYSIKDSGNSIDLLWSIPDKRTCKNVDKIDKGMDGYAEMIENINNYLNGTYYDLYSKLVKELEVI